MKHSLGGTAADLRKIHRWLGIAAAVLFLSVASSGILLQLQQLFGAEETNKERLATMKSPLSLGDPLTVDNRALEAARFELVRRFGRQPVDGIDWKIKGASQSFVFHLGGASPTKVEVDARSALILQIVPDGEAFLLRLHSGEIFGDGGKLLGLFWGLALLAMLVTGILIYSQTYRARQRTAKRREPGWRRFFWIAVPIGLLAQLRSFPDAEPSGSGELAFALNAPVSSSAAFATRDRS